MTVKSTFFFLQANLASIQQSSRDIEETAPVHFTFRSLPPIDIRQIKLALNISINQIRLSALKTKRFN